MTVADAFGRYLDRLQADGALVVARLGDPIADDDLEAAVAVLGGIPGDLRELWTVHDGTSGPRFSVKSELLPYFEFTSSAGAVERRLDRSWPDGEWDLLGGEAHLLDAYGVLVPVFEGQELSLMVDLSNPEEVLIFEPTRDGCIGQTGLTLEALFDAACDLFDSGWIIVNEEGCVTGPTVYPGPPPDVVPDIIGYSRWPDPGTV